MKLLCKLGIHLNKEEAEPPVDIPPHYNVIRTHYRCLDCGKDLYNEFNRIDI